MTDTPTPDIEKRAREFVREHVYIDFEPGVQHPSEREPQMYEAILTFAREIAAECARACEQNIAGIPYGPKGHERTLYAGYDVQPFDQPVGGHQGQAYAAFIRRAAGIEEE